jgi:hypothetical protein
VSVMKSAPNVEQQWIDGNGLTCAELVNLCAANRNCMMAILESGVHITINCGAKMPPDCTTQKVVKYRIISTNGNQPLHVT